LGLDRQNILKGEYKDRAEEVSLKLEDQYFDGILILTNYKVN
jgi:hypothetical protein